MDNYLFSDGKRQNKVLSKEISSLQLPEFGKASGSQITGYLIAFEGQLNLGLGQKGLSLRLVDLELEKELADIPIEILSVNYDPANERTICFVCELPTN
jgi:hypothetical protein